MATTVATPSYQSERVDHLSGTPRAGTVDRWIYVFMAASFIVYVLLGFVPDSIAMVAAVEAGQRPPLPLILHAHAVLMGSFLLLLLAQTYLVATGRCALHMRVGVAGMVLVPALVAVGFVLIPTMYHMLWGAAQAAPPAARAQVQATLGFVENIMLLQIRIGILFPLFLGIGLWARSRDSGLHKRMMILGTAVALPAAFDRIPWLWTTLPENPFTTDLYPLIAVAPMLIWDVIRNRAVHRAYWIWFAISTAAAVLVHAAWDKPWWHATARQIMGV